MPRAAWGKRRRSCGGVIEQSKSYSAARPAILYVSLYGWRNEGTSYIHNRILENLHFRPEQKNFADARYTLDQLMQEPLQTPQGERPVLLLLLDGMNEACGEIEPLLEEISALAKLPGVSLLVSGRNAESGLPFPSAYLEPLTEADVKEGLARHGLLLPESEEMGRLLQTPLMLSIFLQSAGEEGRQLLVNTREELLDAYFAALHSKELRDLPDDAERYWQVDAAITFVLPAIAAQLERKQHSLGDQELLPVVERCYRLFSKRRLRRAFPRWIGRSKAIRGQAANAEEWYGQIVHELLWKRLGLLTRDGQGTYQISHQIIREHLYAADQENQHRIWKQRRKTVGFLAAACVLLLVLGGIVYYKCFRFYNEILAESAYSYGIQSYVLAGDQYEQLRELLDCAVNEPENYLDQLSLYRDHANRAHSTVEQTAAHAAETLEKLLASGSIVPWSWQEIEAPYYEDLYRLSGDRLAVYEALTDVLTWVMEAPKGKKYQKEYQAQFSELIEIDAAIAARLYQIVCLPHAVGKYAVDSDAVEARNIREMVAGVPEQGKKVNTSIKDLKENLNNLYGQRKNILQDNIDFQKILAAYNEDTGIIIQI